MNELLISNFQAAFNLIIFFAGGDGWYFTISVGLVIY